MQWRPVMLDMTLVISAVEPKVLTSVRTHPSEIQGLIFRDASSQLASMRQRKRRGSALYRCHPRCFQRQGRLLRPRPRDHAGS